LPGGFAETLMCVRELRNVRLRRSRAGNAADGVQTHRDYVTCFASLPCKNLNNTCLFTFMSLEYIQRIYIVWQESQTGTLTARWNKAAINKTMALSF